MEEINFEKICRICMGEGKIMMSLFKVSMFKKLMAIASVQVWPKDGLPGQICRRCASKLHIAFQLRRQCERSDRRLRQYKKKVLQEDIKAVEDIQSTVELVDSNLEPQVEVQTVAHRVFIQANGTVIESVAPEESNNYNHFVTTAPNTRHISQIAYTNVTPEGQPQVTAYNIQGHMVYNTPQFDLQNQVMQPDSQLHHSQVIQVEISSPPIQAVTNETANENDCNSKTANDKKESAEGKACTTCGKVFRSNIKLNRHMKIHNTIAGDLPYKCEICGKGFTHGGNYKIHLRIHNNERPFKCPICNKGCRQAQDLEKHLRTHTGERPHKCNFCPKAFATSSNLTAHIRTHTGERPYVCSVCEKAFCQSNELTKHMRTHTGEKSHVCDICNKGFNGSSGLLTHRRKHTGERPYICSLCNRTFTSSNCLASHVKVHNKADPLKCGQCDQGFKTLSNLKEHMTSEHAVSEIIQCKMCDNSFHRVNDYLTHMRSHEEVDS